MSWLKELIFPKWADAERRAVLYAEWLADERETTESLQRNAKQYRQQIASKDDEITTLRARLDRVQPKPRDPRKTGMRTGVKP